MDNYKITIVTSAPIKEIEVYLASQTTKTKNNTYVCIEWEATIDRTWIEKIGSLNLQHTEITFRGREDTVKQRLQAFRLKFLSAGG